MRMLKNSPGIGDGIRPNCEAYGYLLDSNGNCQYIEAYNRESGAASGCEKGQGDGQDLPMHPHAQLRDLACGHYTYRLKDTTRRNDDGSYQLLSRSTYSGTYQFSTDNRSRCRD